MAHLDGQIALVTGASAGIGRAAALNLAAQGARVFAAARRLEKLEELAEEARAHGWLIEPLQLDVTSADSIEQAVQHIRRATNGHEIDILLNNAGYGQMGALEEVPIAALRQQFETNVFGMVALIQQFLPKMRERRAGRILNVSSVGGRLVMPYGGAYSASKFAVEALSDALRLELAPWNIQVVVIEPGPIATEFTEVVQQNIGAGTTAYPQGAAFLRTLMVSGIGTAPSVVAKAIVDVVRRRRPPARKVVPAFYGPLLGFAETLPSVVIDTAFKLILRLIEQRGAASAPAKPRYPTLEE
ncbi:MAG: SDR family oxidoreductase [Herpetosiphonaceae bacterium]|nr:SDR family oxidoreductase [Herpetosiphonaceae bacterium]